MKSATRGKRTSGVEVTNLSQHGFWILIQKRELFLAFEHFPWFEDAPVGKILNVEMPRSNHLYWPDLDVDLAVESIEKPEEFPLVSRGRRKETQTRKRRAPRAGAKRSRPGAARG